MVLFLNLFLQCSISFFLPNSFFNKLFLLCMFHFYISNLGNLFHFFSSVQFPIGLFMILVGSSFFWIYPYQDECPSMCLLFSLVAYFKFWHVSCSPFCVYLCLISFFFIVGYHGTIPYGYPCISWCCLQLYISFSLSCSSIYGLSFYTSFFIPYLSLIHYYMKVL